MSSQPSITHRTGTGLKTGSNGPRTLNTYPHPYFDLSNQDVPRTVKELFRWCLFLYMSHSEIAPLINKKCSYVTTEIVYNTESEKDKKAWQEVLEETLDIRAFERMMLLDYEVFGNAFCSISYPFDRRLVCKSCDAGHRMQDPELKWHYREHRFVGICPACKHKGTFKVEDTQIKRRKAIRLIRWFPEYIQILKNEITGYTRYIYKVPRWIRKGVVNSENDQNKYLVEDMPMVFLDAIREGKDVELDADNIYHMRTEGCSYYDSSYGIPPLLTVFKDAWLYQTYRRAQEAIAVEHILPMRLLIPRPAAGDHSPHMHNDLGAWSSRMQNIVSRWRRDPNAIFTVPFPSDVQNVGGDAQALNVHNDMRQVREQIAGGLDLPADLIYGNMSWSGSSVTLRMLENTFINVIGKLERFLNKFIVERLASWGDLPDIEITHRDFKMADDAQQKQIALSLRQTNTLSDRTVIKELGFDYSTEQKYKREEEEERNQVMGRQMLAQAEAQGRAQVLSAKFEAMAQAAREKAAEEEQRDAQLESYDDLTSRKGRTDMAKVVDSVANPAPGELGGSKLQLSAGMLDMMADNTLKSTPPEMMDDMMQRLGKSNPQLAAAIVKRQKAASTTAMKPLPEQKPPRSPNAGI